MSRLVKWVDKIKQNQFFRKFFLSYMLILGFSAILSTIIYMQFCDVVEETAVEGYESMLLQSAQTLEEDLEAIDTLYYNFLGNSQIIKVINSNTVYDREKFSEIKEIFDFMPPLSSEGNALVTYLVLPRQETVVSAASTYRYSRFYDYFINHDDVSPQLWEELVTEKQYDRFIGGHYEDEEYVNASKLLHVRTMPLNSLTPTASVITAIPVQRLEKTFSWFREQNCSIILMDQDDNVLYALTQDSVSIPQELLEEENAGNRHEVVYLDGEKYLCAYESIDAFGLHLISFTPAEKILAPAHKLQRQILVLLAVFMLFGFALTVILASRNSRPLDEVVSLIESSFSQYRNEGIGSLQNAISDLIANDNRAKQIVERDLPYIQSEQRKRLLLGELILNRGETPVMLEDISGKSYNVLVIELIGPPGVDSLRSLLEFSMVKKTIHECENLHPMLRGYFVDLANSICAMIISSDETDHQKNVRYVETFAKEIFSRLETDGSVFLKFAAGGFHANLSDVYYSYLSARELLESGILNPDQSVIWDIPQSQEFAYYFSLQLEQRLIVAVSSGNREETEKLLQMIYIQNFEDHRIQDRMITRLYDELNGVVYKLLAQLEGTVEEQDIVQVNKNIREIRKHQNILPPDQMFLAYQDTLSFLCCRVKPKQKSKNSTMRPQLTEYMQKNYADPSFGLAVLADHFGFSEIYMSQLFKENMGTTFSEYLERLRIDTACSLLKESQMTISDISQRAGYYSPHAFRRAFKRVTGVLPTDYRSLN